MGPLRLRPFFLRVGRLFARGPPRGRLGPRGERLAERTLSGLGYRILFRNLRTPGGEVDLVALDGETLVLVEVKATSGARDPSDRVAHAKRRRLRAARAWLARRDAFAHRPFRFDVVAVREGSGPARVRVRRGSFRA